MPSHTTHRTAKIFLEKLRWKLLPIYKTVAKIDTVVQKSFSVYGRYLHFCSFVSSVLLSHRFEMCALLITCYSYVQCSLGLMCGVVGESSF